MLRAKEVAEADAAALIESVMVERDQTLRAEGVKKVVYGVLFAVAPVAYYGIALLMEVIFLKLMVALCVLGVVGIYQLSVGASMVMKPRSYTGGFVEFERVNSEPVARFGVRRLVAAFDDDIWLVARCATNFVFLKHSIPPERRAGSRLRKAATSRRTPNGGAA